MANWSLGSSLRSGSISLKPAFSKILVEVLVFVKMPCQLGGVEDKKGLEVSLMGGTSESEEHSAMRSLLASLPI